MPRRVSLGVSAEVTRAALILRMFSLLFVFLPPTQITPLGAAGQLAVGGVSLWLVASEPARQIVERHPLVVVLDTALVATVAVATGVGSPFVLTFMTCAVLIGLWTNRYLGLALVTALCALNWVFWPMDPQGLMLGLVFVPFVIITLWWLGYAVQQAGQDQRRSWQTLQRAIGVTAAHEERTRLARELHDTLAKSLQAMNLTAAALPVVTARDPGMAVEHARELQQLSVRAIEDARSLMTELRRAPTSDALPLVMRDLCEEWQGRTGIPVIAELADDADVADELTRYEILMTVSEALENVRRHARAGAVTVSLRSTGESIEAVVADDGVGFPAERLPEAERDGHFGCRGMAERMERVGGAASIRSAPGEGTRVVLGAPRRGLIETEGGI